MIYCLQLFENCHCDVENPEAKCRRKFTETVGSLTLQFCLVWREHFVDQHCFCCTKLTPHTSFWADFRIWDPCVTSVWPSTAQCIHHTSSDHHTQNAWLQCRTISGYVNFTVHWTLLLRGNYVSLQLMSACWPLPFVSRQNESSHRKIMQFWSRKRSLVHTPSKKRCISDVTDDALNTAHEQCSCTHGLVQTHPWSAAVPMDWYKHTLGLQSSFQPLLERSEKICKTAEHLITTPRRKPPVLWKNLNWSEKEQKSKFKSVT